MAMNGNDPKSGRETRLLVLVVGVSLAVLLLLAQFQFPGSDLSVVTPSAAPLAGLAARATFDEMANTMADVLARVSPSLVVVQVGPEPPGDPPAGRGTPARRSTASVEPATTAVEPPLRLMPALRVRRDLALVHMPVGMRPVAIADSEGPIEVMGHDPSRGAMLVRVPESVGFQDMLSGALRALPGLSYVAVVDATAAGPTIQPIFIGRADTVIDPRWSHPLVTVGGAPGMTPGAFVFGINSRLIGLVVQDAEGGTMIVPASALETVVAALEAGAGSQ